MARDNQAWRDFFEFEQHFYRYLHNNCEPLHVVPGREPYYREFSQPGGGKLVKPPRFIHWIGRLTPDDGEYLEWEAQLKALYKVAVGDQFKRFPVRFPAHHRAVDQINITLNTAFESKPVTGRMLVLKDRAMPESAEHQKAIKDEFHQLASVLDAAALPAYVRTVDKFTPYGRVAEYLELAINTSDLYRYAGWDKIQKRLFTGEQYRALIRHGGETAGIRCKLGLIVLDRHSADTIIVANPQAPRPHSLEASGARIILPIETTFRLYRKARVEEDEIVAAGH